MLNVTAVGNLAADPIQRNTQDGTNVTSFTLLVNKKGKGEEITTQVVCSIWGNYGNVAMQFLKKGNQVTVSGSAICRSYLRKNGEPGASIDLKVNDFVLPQRPRTQENQIDPPF